MDVCRLVCPRLVSPSVWKWKQGPSHGAEALCGGGVAGGAGRGKESSAGCHRSSRWKEGEQCRISLEQQEEERGAVKDKLRAAGGAGGRKRSRSGYPSI